MFTQIIIITCYIIFAYGVANMICYAEGPWGIFEWWRGFAHDISEGFGTLFTCMMCLSTWVGVLFSVIDLLFTKFNFTPFNLLFGYVMPWWLIIILDAGFTSGAVWLIHNFEEACERHGIIEYYEEKDNNKKRLDD